MRETLEGYDHTKYNVNKRMTQFKGKVEKIFTDIYSLREVIKHIPSVGEPYFMAARKRRKTAFDNKRSLLQIDSSNVSTIFMKLYRTLLQE